MPKQVDHEERRREIGEALFRVAATRGLEAVSLRHVAAEAGVSMGRVQHYFASKDEMLLYAFDLVSERVARRLQALPVAEPRSFLRSLLLELLPLNAAAREEAPVLAAFLAQAVVEPRLARKLQEGAPRMAEWLAGYIRAVRPEGDAEKDASMLTAFVDGLMLHVLTGQVSAETAVELVDLQLDRVFTAG